MSTIFQERTSNCQHCDLDLYPYAQPHYHYLEGEGSSEESLCEHCYTPCQTVFYTGRLDRQPRYHLACRDPKGYFQQLPNKCTA